MGAAVGSGEVFMTVQELIETLQALPKDAKDKTVHYQRTALSEPHEIQLVDYDLTTVALLV